MGREKGKNTRIKKSAPYFRSLYFYLVSVTDEMPEPQNILCRTALQSHVFRNILLSDYPLVLVLQVQASKNHKRYGKGTNKI
jgi:hypothetical protein